jgi:hypothetical protein
MTARTEPQKRLLIGASCFADAQPALRLAEQLTETLAGDLGGMLIEETIVTEAFDLPGQRVVTSGGTLVVVPSCQQIRSLIESDAKAFRNSLVGLARTTARKWSFERRHGELISGLCEAATGWDILLLGHREIHHQAGKLVLITPPGAAAQSAAGLALDLVKRLRADLVALSIGPEIPELNDVQSQQRERFASEVDLLAFINRTNASAVVLDLSAGPFHTHDQLRHVLAAARCPVLVLGAAQGEPSIAHSTQIPPAP